MTAKERAERFAALKNDLVMLKAENRDWLTVRVIELQDDLRNLDIAAAQRHLTEILEAVVEDE